MPRTLNHPNRTSIEPSPATAAILGAIGHHAGHRPQAVAIATAGTAGSIEDAITYSQLSDRAGTLAEIISTSTANGAVVMLIGPGCPELGLWMVACFMAGVAAFPVPFHTSVHELKDLARRSGASLIVGCGGAAEQDGACFPGDIPWIEWHLAASDMSGTDVRSLARNRKRDPGSIVLHSSGTTGVSKLALRDMTALDADAVNIVRAMRLTTADTVLMATPLSHSYGVDMLVAALLAGSTLHVVPAFDLSAIAAHLSERTTVFPSVPFVFEALAGLAAGNHPKQLRLAISAGAPLPEDVRVGFESQWRVHVGDLYGATELGSVTLNDPGSPLFVKGSVGTGFPGVGIRIVDPVNPARELTVGREGHVAIAAPSMLSRYLDGEVPLADGHLLTGDLGRVDELGRLFITGRLKLLIDAGGIKVNPLEVEAALRSHPDVLECAVVPIAFTGTISRLRAVFVPRDLAYPPTETELRSFLREHLSGPKIPRIFDAVASLPKSPTGKILRGAIVDGGARA